MISIFGGLRLQAAVYETAFPIQIIVPPTEA